MRLKNANFRISLKLIKQNGSIKLCIQWYLSFKARSLKNYMNVPQSKVFGNITFHLRQHDFCKIGITLVSMEEMVFLHFKKKEIYGNDFHYLYFYCKKTQIDICDMQMGYMNAFSLSEPHYISQFASGYPVQCQPKKRKKNILRNIESGLFQIFLQQVVKGYLIQFSENVKYNMVRNRIEF